MQNIIVLNASFYFIVSFLSWGGNVRTFEVPALPHYDGDESIWLKKHSVVQHFCSCTNYFQNLRFSDMWKPSKHFSYKCYDGGGGVRHSYSSKHSKPLKSSKPNKHSKPSKFSALKNFHNSWKLETLETLKSLKTINFDIIHESVTKHLDNLYTG